MIEGRFWQFLPLLNFASELCSPCALSLAWTEPGKSGFLKVRRLYDARAAHHELNLSAQTDTVHLELRVTPCEHWVFKFWLTNVLGVCAAKLPKL
eukprot:4474953-Amphidinium_carterae.1